MAPKKFTDYSLKEKARYLGVLIGIPLAFVIFLFVGGFIVESIGAFAFGAIWLANGVVWYYSRNSVN